MLKISYAGCLGLFPAIAVQFIVKMDVAGQNYEKFTKTPFWNSRSCKVTDVNKSNKKSQAHYLAKQTLLLISV